MKVLRHSSLISILLSSSALLLAPSPGIAQTVPLETITINGQRGDNAVDVAPTPTPLDALQPTFRITQTSSRRTRLMTANYDEAIVPAQYRQRAQRSAWRKAKIFPSAASRTGSSTSRSTVFQ